MNDPGGGQVTTTDAAKYPLAHKQGIANLVAMVNAMDLWSQATTKQRQLIQEAAAPVVDAIRGNPGEDRIVLDNPPKVSAPARTLESMRRKGIVDERGWLTMDAITTAHIQARMEQRGESL